MTEKTIRALRQARGMSMERLAMIAGMNYPYLSRLERGLLPLTAAAAERLSPYLGVSAAVLVEAQAGLREQERSRLEAASRETVAA